MSISIYYSVRRNTSLTIDENIMIQDLIEKYSVEEEIKKYQTTGKGLNWESFCLYEDLENTTILEGSTKLPNNNENAAWIAIQHWCKLLTEIRRICKNAKWEVGVESHLIHWDEEKEVFDPSI
jgi:hypothetical protein